MAGPQVDTQGLSSVLWDSCNGVNSTWQRDVRRAVQYRADQRGHPAHQLGVRGRPGERAGMQCVSGAGPEPPALTSIPDMECCCAPVSCPLFLMFLYLRSINKMVLCTLFTYLLIVCTVAVDFAFACVCVFVLLCVGGFLARLCVCVCVSVCLFGLGPFPVLYLKGAKKPREGKRAYNLNTPKLHLNSCICIPLGLQTEYI